MPLNRPTSPTPTITVPPPYSVDEQSTSPDPTISDHLSRSSSISDAYTVAVASHSSSYTGTVVPIEGVLAAPPPSNSSTIQQHTSIPPIAARQVLIGPGNDPFVDALEHAAELGKLYKKCGSSVELQNRHFGEIVVSMTRLLRKAKLLDAISSRFEHGQLKSLLEDSQELHRLKTSRMTGGQMMPIRNRIWTNQGKRLAGLEAHLEEEHLVSGINGVVAAISELEMELRPRSENRITQ